jgi:hypothetical protein
VGKLVKNLVHLALQGKKGIFFTPSERQLFFFQGINSLKAIFFTSSGGLEIPTFHGLPPFGTGEPFSFSMDILTKIGDRWIGSEGKKYGETVLQGIFERGAAKPGG